MYVANRVLGIGQVIETTETHLVVYFEESDKTKEFLKSFVELFNTEEEADEFLNPTISDEECNAILEQVKEDNRIIEEGQKACFEIERIEIERAKLMMKNK